MPTSHIRCSRVDQPSYISHPATNHYPHIHSQVIVIALRGLEHLPSFFLFLLVSTFVLGFSFTGFTYKDFVCFFYGWPQVCMVMMK
jgi:hypothetical protein